MLNSILNIILTSNANLFVDIIQEKSAWDLIRESGLFAKLVLFMLIMFSVISWAIMLWKWRQFARVESDNAYFMSRFRSSNDLKSSFKDLAKIKFSPFARMFKESFGEWDYCISVEKELSKSDSPKLGEQHFKIISDSASCIGEEELSRLGGYVTFLATTANASPFLGLLGTVWGIMGSFSAIGTRGSASLAIVAPGIAEALIATVAGLAAAIPAVVGYNYFNNRLRVMGVGIDNFKLELMNAFRRENLLNKKE